MTDYTTLERAASAIFAAAYSEKDDPGFPGRLWSQMTEDQKRMWYRFANAALAAIEAESAA